MDGNLVTKYQEADDLLKEFYVNLCKSSPESIATDEEKITFQTI